MNEILRIENLTVNYYNRGEVVLALQEVNLSMQKGSILAVVGESGCGKTTLAMSIVRLLPETAFIEKGKVLFRERDILTVSEEELGNIRGRKIAYIFQDPTAALNPVISVGEQLIETITNCRRLSSKEAFQEAVRLLGLVKIPNEREHLKFYPHQLSGGMNQRIMIALALASKPEVLIADEPTSNLDVTIEASILELLGELRLKLKLSIIFITHDLSLVKFLADETAVIYQGKLVEFRKTAELFTNPEHAYTKELLEASLVISGL